MLRYVGKQGKIVLLRKVRKHRKPSQTNLSQASHVAIVPCIQSFNVRLGRPSYSLIKQYAREKKRFAY